MDTGATDDSDYEDSEREASLEDVIPSTGLPRDNQVETVASARNSPVKNFHSSKWSRLGKQHNPKYLDLFRKSWQDDYDPTETEALEASQIGVVRWQPDEKVRVFRALERHGRHDLSLLSREIGTKSELEVKQYLDILQRVELDRQLFSRQTKNITGFEIPAAIEIGVELEGVLEKAADALAANQEQYDFAVASRGYELPYIITKDVATQMDASTDAKELALNDADLENRDLAVQKPDNMFKITNMCGLSEDIFMQGTGDRPMDNWMNVAESGELPSITQDVLADLYELVESLTRRIIQTVIFVTDSRIRATTSSYRRPSATIGIEDVETALDILNLKQSLWNFWVTFPGRRGLGVRSGSHQKGATKTAFLDLDEVKAKLSEPQYRGRHSRSRSHGSASGISEETSTASADLSGSEMSLDGDGMFHSPQPAEADYVDAEEELEEEELSEYLSDEQRADPAPVSRTKRKRLLEEEQDRYMEELDQQARQAEEQRIVNLLGLEDAVSHSEEEDHPLRKRPKVLRKGVEDVYIWRAPYLAEWEARDMTASVFGCGTSAVESRGVTDMPPSSELSS
ncbi:uncharacterized protein HMPREF1541_08953 [Cyphellophora europaea CBS 101466]|uniref:Myb-like domain-containing protein n=1 Tax=Cyphellophora europaea (strain CBS 101466) TaxID=1220924 RepID=W2RK03_CYPE1|nr:uncharacterized protein HMPREF1541_08953 [Cyphellophora europaea CBS 101466]ETN36675.1 hypothetical protein HMPREF1541_08953 [Cyphellophora europaea CBS 101466]